MSGRAVAGLVFVLLALVGLVPLLLTGGVSGAELEEGRDGYLALRLAAAELGAEVAVVSEPPGQAGAVGAVLVYGGAGVMESLEAPQRQAALEDFVLAGGWVVALVGDESEWDLTQELWGSELWLVKLVELEAGERAVFLPGERMRLPEGVELGLEPRAPVRDDLGAPKFASLRADVLQPSDMLDGLSSAERRQAQRQALAIFQAVGMGPTAGGVCVTTLGPQWTNQHLFRGDGMLAFARVVESATGAAFDRTQLYMWTLPPGGEGNWIAYLVRPPLLYLVMALILCVGLLVWSGGAARAFPQAPLDDAQLTARARATGLANLMRRSKLDTWPTDSPDEP